MNAFDKLVAVINDSGLDATKAYDGNKAAGTRVRLAMQEVKKLAQEVREEMLNIRG